MKEISWINWAKVICLVFVYLDHSLFYLQVYDNFPWLESLYHPFFVNIFFFMSGYLLFGKQLSPHIISIPRWLFITNYGKTMILNILNKIVLPTILFSAILYLPKKLIRSDGFSTISFIKDTILGGSIWFTCALAVAELLVLIMLLSRQRNVYFYICFSVILSISAVIINNMGFSILSSPNIPWFYKSGMIATIFLSFGGLYNRYEILIDKMVGKYYVIITIILVYICLEYLYPGYIKVSLYHASINVQGLLIALTSIYAIIFLSKKLKSIPLINHLGHISLGIYLLSGGIPNVLGIIFIKYGFQNIYINVLLVTMISFVIGIITVMVLNQICPFVFNFKILSDK